MIGQEFKVASDPGATYAIESVTRDERGRLLIVSTRVGKMSASISERLFDPKARKCSYLRDSLLRADFDTKPRMPEKMWDLTADSISATVCARALECLEQQELAERVRSGVTDAADA